MKNRKFRARYSDKPKIEEVEIVSESEKFVTLPWGRREAKDSEGIIYRDTFEEAKSACAEALALAVAVIKLDLERAKGKLKAAKRLERDTK